MPNLEDEFRHRLKRAVYALTEISLPREGGMAAARKNEMPKPAEELVVIAVSALRDLKVDRRMYTVLTKTQHDRNTHKDSATSCL